MDQKLKQIKNRSDLYEKVALSAIAEYKNEQKDFPSFDYATHPWEHAYVMILRDFFSMNGKVTNGNAVLFRLPTEPKATGSHATSIYFRRKVEAFISKEVVNFAEYYMRLNRS